MERSDCRECEDLPTLEIKRWKLGFFDSFIGLIYRPVQGHSLFGLLPKTKLIVLKSNKAGFDAYS